MGTDMPCAAGGGTSHPSDSLGGGGRVLLLRHPREREHLRLVLREAERRECDVDLGGDLAPRGNGYGYHELGALRDYLPHL